MESLKRFVLSAAADSRSASSQEVLVKDTSADTNMVTKWTATMSGWLTREKLTGDTNVVSKSPKGSKAKVAAVQVEACSAPQVTLLRRLMPSDLTTTKAEPIPACNTTKAIPATTNKINNSFEAAGTAPPADETPSSNAATTATSSSKEAQAAGSSIFGKVAAMGREALEATSKAGNKTVKTRKKWVKQAKKGPKVKKAPVASAPATSAAGEVGQGVGAAFVSGPAMLPAGAGALVSEGTGAAAAAAAGKPSRGPLGRKVHWAAKRLGEARQGVKEGVASAKEGVRKQLQALRQRCSSSSKIQ